MLRIVRKVLATPAVAENLVPNSFPVAGTIGYHFSKKYREFPHRMLWRRKSGVETSSWNQCRKSHESLAANFTQIQIGDRVMLITDSDVHMFNITLAAQKRAAQCCIVPIKGLTTSILEKYISQLRPRIIFIAKDKARIFDPLSENEDPKKMTLDLYGMIWKTFPISSLPSNSSLTSTRYPFVEGVVLCDQAEALNHHDMITNIKYFETPREQDYYESPLVHIAYHMRPEYPALSIVDPKNGKWTTHTHQSLISGGQLFANSCFGSDERVLLLPGTEATAGGYLTMYAVIQGSGVLCFAEDQMVSKGDCKRVTRAVFQHEATTIVGNKEQWVHLLQYGDAAEKRDDPNKHWFKTLKWVAVFLDDMETEDGIEEQIKQAFGIQRVHIIRGSPETLNFTLIDGKLPSFTDVRIKSDADDVSLVNQTEEGRVWLKGLQVTPFYWNYIGLMTLPKDDQGYVKMPYHGKMENKVLKITRKEDIPELIV